MRYIGGAQGPGKILLVDTISLDIRKLIKFCAEKDPWSGRGLGGTGDGDYLWNKVCQVMGEISVWRAMTASTLISKLSLLSV